MRLLTAGLQVRVLLAEPKQGLSQGGFAFFYVDFKSCPAAGNFSESFHYSLYCTIMVNRLVAHLANNACTGIALDC